MLPRMFTFWSRHYYHLLLFYSVVTSIASSKIMIPNIHQSVPRLFFATNGIDWWKTPPESPDLNPIENLWHELKEYIRRQYTRCRR